jgi:hypothetical protein
MRSFSEILRESKKTYQFKVGIAGELPEGFINRLETALEKYSLVKMSSGKKTPIQERPLDFPQLQNTEVTYFEVEINYPTISSVLQEYLGAACSVHTSKIIVRNTSEPVERIQDLKTDEVYDPLITKEELGGESAQKSVGGNRVMELLKELETARKERVDPTADAPKEKESKMNDKTNSKSVVGS